MEEQSLLSFTDELLETNCICCSICKEILKPPIMLIENIGNICATCHDARQDVMDWRSLNNTALETILKILKLPCKFQAKGCTERLSHEDLIIHQSNCKYRTLLCSIFKFPECNWTGSITDFVHHFKEDHGDHVINFENNLFFLQTSLRDLDVVKLLVMKNQTYILHMQTNLEKKKLFYFICTVMDDPDLFLDYSVKHKGSSDNYIKIKSKILPPSNIYSEFDESVAVQLNLEALKQIAHISDTITNIFKIKVDDNSQSNRVDEKMLHFLECPICKNAMKPPIYQCISGHSICNACRSRLEKCPTCRSGFGTTRNYSLEGLTSGVYYTCMYNDLGCTQTSTVSEIVKHESECPFKPYKCPFPRCTSTGNHQGIIKHLNDSHPEGISTSPVYTDLYRLDQTSGYSKVFTRKFVTAYNHIFRLTCKKLPEHCLWAAEVIGPNNHLKTFLYEIAIVDIHRPGKKIIRTDYCLNEMAEDELFKRCIMFPSTILASYCNNGVVRVRFTIRENAPKCL